MVRGVFSTLDPGRRPAVTLAGCGDNPAAPDIIVLTGTWAGQVSDSSGPGRISWQLTQSGSVISGSVTIDDPDTSFQARGILSGTVSGSLLRFSLQIPAGGFDDPYRDCTANVAGDAQLTSGSLTGTYSGTNSCTGPISSGQITVVKQ